tara:strand:- start:2269 stop:2967 length:699 start_codon:yes stop_codon:yes gene_type:complete
MAADFGHRIKDFIGFDYHGGDTANLTSEDQAIETACAEVIDALPDSLLLANAEKPASIIHGTADSSFNSEGKKILRVLRKDDRGYNRVCEEVDVDTFNEMQDEDSIYFPTQHSPVYTLDATTGTTKLKIRPSVRTDLINYAGTVYSVTYPIAEDFTDDLDDLTSIPGLPHEAEHAVALKASIYILQTLISDAVQDEEDDEMLSMLQTQLQSLTAMYTAELQRLMQSEGVGGE